jgi:hypothetical protein
VRARHLDERAVGEDARDLAPEARVEAVVVVGVQEAAAQHVLAQPRHLGLAQLDVAVPGHVQVREVPQPLVREAHARLGALDGKRGARAHRLEQVGRLDGLAYQSPPPSYCRRATVSAAPAVAALAGARRGCPAAGGAAHASAAARATPGYAPPHAAARARCAAPGALGIAASRASSQRLRSRPRRVLRGAVGVVARQPEPLGERARHLARRRARPRAAGARPRHARVPRPAARRRAPATTSTTSPRGGASA